MRRAGCHWLPAFCLPPLSVSVTLPVGVSIVAISISVPVLVVVAAVISQSLSTPHLRLVAGALGVPSRLLRASAIPIPVVASIAVSVPVMVVVSILAVVVPVAGDLPHLRGMGQKRGLGCRRTDQGGDAHGDDGDPYSENARCVMFGVHVGFLLAVCCPVLLQGYFGTWRSGKGSA